MKPSEKAAVYTYMLKTVIEASERLNIEERKVLRSSIERQLPEARVDGVLELLGLK